MSEKEQQPKQNTGLEEENLTHEEKFEEAKKVFEAMLERDFPDFSVEQYAEEKAEHEGVDTDTLASKIWSGTKAFPAKLDLTGDGKVGLDDAKLVLDKTGKGIGKAWSSVTSISKEDISDATRSAKDSISGTGKKVLGFNYSGTLKKASKKVKDSANSVDGDTFKSAGSTAVKIGKTASGIQGLQNRKEASEIKAVGEDYTSAAETLTEKRREELNQTINHFGFLRLESLHETLRPFLKILEDLKQKNRVKEYELLDGIGIDTKTLESMGKLDMSVSQSLRSTATTGAFGVAAVLGTPALVTGAVGALATASTGTAISSLSGAAASNAILAWLGGGSLAAGGGGMAAGAVVLTGITVGATAGVTILSAGILVSTHYAKKLTEAKMHQKEVALAVASLESAWIVMDGITKRVNELVDVTRDLKKRTLPKLSQLEEIVPVFDADNKDHAKLFNQTGLLIKTMVELAQVPLLGDEGELTEESMTVTAKVKKVLNTEI